MQYQLKIVKRVQLSSRKALNVTTIFAWDDKEDALECKKLIDRASKNIRDTKVLFVEHVPDKLLEV